VFLLVQICTFDNAWQSETFAIVTVELTTPKRFDDKFTQRNLLFFLVVREWELDLGRRSSAQ